MLYVLDNKVPKVDFDYLQIYDTQDKKNIYKLRLLRTLSVENCQCLSYRICNKQSSCHNKKVHVH